MPTKFLCNQDPNRRTTSEEDLEKGGWLDKIRKQEMVPNLKSNR